MAHRDKPADLGKALLKLSTTDSEKAYAFGWLMHIVTDIEIHQLVNRQVAVRFHQGKISALKFSEDPLGHHRVEWGIDVFLLKEESFKSRIPNVFDVLDSTGDVDQLIKNAYRQTYNYDLFLETWRNAVAGKIKYIGLFDSVWRVAGRIPSSFFAFQALKNLLYYLIQTS